MCAATFAAKAKDIATCLMLEQEFYSKLPDLTDLRIKRLAKANIFGAVIIALNAIGWGTGYWMMALYPLMLFSFSYVIYALIVLKLNQTGHYFWGIGMTLSGAAVWIVLIALSISGPGSGYGGAVHANFLVLAVIGYYLFRGISKSVQASVSSLMVLLFLGFHFPPVAFEPIIQLPIEQKVVAGGITWLLVAVMLAFFFYWLRVDVLSYENGMAYSSRKLRSILTTGTTEKALGHLANRNDMQVMMYANSTIILLDIDNFAELDKAYAAEELARMLSDFYTDVDEATSELGLEKINKKGYIFAAAGLSKFDNQHAEKVLTFAKKLTQIGEKHVSLKLKFGISTGAFNAITFTDLNFIADVWGEAVAKADAIAKTNTKSHISFCDSTYQLVKHKFIGIKQQNDISGSNFNAGCYALNSD